MFNTDFLGSIMFCIIVEIYVMVFCIMLFILLQVYSLEDGPVHDIWRGLGVPVSIIQNTDQPDLNVDWLKYVFRLIV